MEYRFCNNMALHPEHTYHLDTYHLGGEGAGPFQCMGASVSQQVMERHPSYIAQRGKLTHREAIVALDKYITDRHTTLWGGVWTVTSEDRREEAIDWFIGVCQEIGLLATPELPTTAPATSTTPTTANLNGGLTIIKGDRQ